MDKTDNSENSLINFFLWFLGIFAVWILSYILSKTSASNQTSILLLLIPTIGGIIYENIRLSSNWKYILLKIFGAIILSLAVFYHPKSDINFVFEEHIGTWAYTFITLFVLISMFYHNDKTIIKLTEGTTLLQSISFIYWILDTDITNNIVKYCLLPIYLVFTLISIIHSLSYVKLTENYRLTLSIWSSFIMVVFSINSIVSTINSQGYKQYGFYNIALNSLQYFILGVSLIYIFKNISMFMLWVYLPSNNEDYQEERRKMNRKHIQRFSKNQIKIKDSLVAIAFTTTLYVCNHIFHFLPSKTLIWCVFILFPILIYQKNRLKKLV